MLNFFAQKKRLFAFLAIALVITTIAFTVIVSQEQQTIKQRASFNALPSGKQIALYFASSGNCNTPLTETVKLAPNQPVSLSLCLSAATDYVSGISGFNITLSADKNLIFQSADATDDAAKFDSQPLPQRLNLNKAVHFTRIRTGDNIPNNPLRILDFTATTPIAENGKISISTAEITSLTQDELLAVDTLPTLSYNSGVSASNPTCGDTTCSADQTCIAHSSDNSPYCFAKGTGGIGLYCGTKDKISNSNACVSGYCDPTSLLCTVAPTPTTTSNLFTCETLTSGAYKGEYGCFNLKSGGVQCPNSDWTEYTPPTSSTFTGTSCETNVPKQGCCVKVTPTPTPTSPPQAICYEFECKDNVYNGFSCEGNFSTQTATFCTASNPYVINDCRANGINSIKATSCIRVKQCTCPIAPTPTPTATPTPTPTSAPVNNVTLYLTLNAQDVPLVSDNLPLSANLILYNLTTNSQVSGAPAAQSFVKTSIPGKQYAANVSLANLEQAKHFIVARKDNMIAKSVFTVSSANETIRVPTTTLVFGDINNDNNINAIDWNINRNCWKNKVATGICASSDFNGDGVIDQVDFNTLMRGWATWNTEGKE